MLGSTWDTELRFESVSKSFGERRVLREVSASIRTGQILAVAGPNGSGKSTLLRIAAGLLHPSSGRVRLIRGGTDASSSARRALIGMVSPDLTLYDELSALENLRFFARVRQIDDSTQRLLALLDLVGLAGRHHDLTGSYSSGMKQRLRYAFALLHNPPVLLLDEPTANLDEAGAALVRRLIDERKQPSCVVLASNEPEEVALGDVVVRLGS
ncbi:MAG: ABC transporter ATP-binding protein [Firmicutes bacterium]|nr:ABC transporter ATP-binding protein [Bacillota bacterium]